MARCRARNKTNGNLCKNLVTKAGQRCNKHERELEAGPRPPRPTKRRPSSTTSPARTTPASLAHTDRRLRNDIQGAMRAATRDEARRQDRIAAAAAACSDILVDGWPEIVASRATDYVSDATWNRLFRWRRRKHCKALAEIAEGILTAKKGLHDAVGSLGGALTAALGGGSVEQAFARELASRIPLPPDDHLVAVARGIQITGILLCVERGDDVTRCQCFINLALTETKARVTQILTAAAQDWTSLARFAPTLEPAKK